MAVTILRGWRHVSTKFSFQWYWRWVILALSFLVADVSFLSTHRFIRSSAIDGCREHPSSSIGGRDRPAVTKAGQDASPSRAGGSPHASPVWGHGGSHYY